MRRANWRWFALIGVLVVLLLVVVSCLIQPDQTVNVVLPTNPVVEPFKTAPPSAGPGEDGQGGTGGTDQQGQGGTSPTSGVLVITASPSPAPVWTYSPAPTSVPTADTTLRNGSSGQAVRTLQQRLKELGYYTGTVDGDFGMATETALKAFQRNHGLTADGVAGANTMAKLNSSDAKKVTPAPEKTTSPTAKAGAYATSIPTPKQYTPSTLAPGSRYLQLGSTGADVKKMQNRLKELDYYYGTASGTFDEATELALMAFQKRNGLYSDGIAGQDTQNKLYENNALPAAAGSTPAASGDYRSLKLDMTGDDVSRVQARLTTLGYYTGKVDGTYGLGTATAVKAFQQRNGLTADGVAGTSTQTRLYSSTAIAAAGLSDDPTPTTFNATGTLQIGSSGDAVKKLQERLFDLGYYKGSIDGIYGEGVASAVRAFQTAHKLTVDGKAGANTQTTMFASSAKKASTATDNYTTLRSGDSGERVRALQTLLSSYGYFNGTVNGSYDSATVLAVQKFQAQNGLGVDGVAGPATQQLLYLGTPKRATDTSIGGLDGSTFTALKQGMSGNDVMVMQQYLQDLGYYGGTLNGVFDATTFVAVQAFQQRNGLTADGVAGQQTLALLYSGDALAAPGFGQSGVPPLQQRAGLKQGDEGQDVFDLQQRLTQLGYLRDAPDGMYGASTISAVKQFQQKNNLAADGEVGQATLAALYAVGVVAAVETEATVNITTLSNEVREEREQYSAGAIQGSLSGGGVAAAKDGALYLAGNTLIARSGGKDTTVYDGQARFLHATDKGVTFVSDGAVLRIPAAGGAPVTLLEAGGIGKFTMIGETMYYMEGSVLVRAFTQGGEGTVLAENIRDFCLDVFERTAYVAGDDGIRRVSLAEEGVSVRVVSTPADQVQLVDSVLYFRSGGDVYALRDGVPVKVLGDQVEWMALYRDKLYAIIGDRLYRADPDGQNLAEFYDGLTAEVSFVSGKAYITANPGGEIVATVDTE